MRLPFFIAAICTLCCASAHAATVEGKVTDSTGKPIPGASVAILNLAQTFLVTNKATPPTIVQTGNDGSFKVEIADKPATLKINQAFEGVAARARIQANGFAPADTMLSATNNTIALQPPVALRGTVVDTGGKPLPDVLLRWRSHTNPVIPAKNNFSPVRLSRCFPAPETRTAADGTFSIPGAGMGQENLLTLEDPRYQFELLRVVSGGEPPKLVAKPTGTVQGRVIGPDDTPTANTEIQIFAGFNYYNSHITTGPDGRFTIQNLPKPPLFLQILPPHETWLAEPRIIEILGDGEVKELEDWKLFPGAEVTGQLVDSTTGQPTRGVSVTLATRASDTGVTDDQGRFRLRTLPEPDAVLVANSETSVYISKQVPLNLAGKTSLDLGKIDLTRGTIIEGTAQLEGTAKWAEIHFSLLHVETADYKHLSFQSDGKFNLGALPPGTYRFTESPLLAWDLEPKTFTVVPPGQTQPPLQLKVKARAVKTVRGRVVTPDGVPIEGAIVRVNLRSKQPGDSWRQITTNAEGRFSMPNIPSGVQPTLTEIQRDGYSLRTTGQGTEKPDAWEFSDTLLTPRTAIIKGRILDENGAPVAGALVTESENAGKRLPPIKTAADGSFTLKKLPQNEVTILAAHEKTFRRATTTPGQDVEIRLAVPAPLGQQQRIGILQTPKTLRTTLLTSYGRILSDETLLEMALYMDGALTADAPLDPARAGNNVATVLSDIAERDPVKAAKWGWEQLERFPQVKENSFLLLPLYQAVAAYGDEAAREEIRQQLRDRKLDANGREEPFVALVMQFRLAALASLLKEPRANAYLDMGVLKAEALDKNIFADAPPFLGRFVAPGGLTLLEYLAADWTVPQRFKAFCGATATLGLYHPDQMPELMRRIDALNADPAVKDSDKEGDKAGRRRSTSAEALDRARAEAAAWYAKSDPAKALTLLEQVSEPRLKWTASYELLESALEKGDKDLAARVLKLNEPERDIDKRSYFAARTQAWNPALSEAMFSSIRTELEKTALQPYGDTGANYAFHRAPQEPATSRLTLEAELDRRLDQMKKGDEAIAYSLPRLAVAMAPLDTARALEILNLCPDKYGNKDLAQAQLAVYFWGISPARDTMPLTQMRTW